MKAQMRFQKYICLVMLIVGALALLYSFCYSTGSLSELAQMIDTSVASKPSRFMAAAGKNDATLVKDIQGFNNLLMYMSIVMILFAVVLYITGCNKRRNYYISNYVATGLCAGGNIIISVILMILNGIWRGKFLNVDFAAWKARNEAYVGMGAASHYSESTTWFDIGFAVYVIVILASVVLILNLVWKIKLMQGEKKLLNGEAVGGAAV